MNRRKKIPDRVKLLAALKRQGLRIEEVEFDHEPALALRPLNPETGDTIPPANDPDHIRMLLIKEHDVKTNGPGGEKRITTAGSDKGKIKKVRKLSQQQKEFRRRMLEKEPGQNSKPESKWPRRPMSRKTKGKTV